MPTRITYLFVVSVSVVVVVFGLYLFHSIRERTRSEYEQRTVRELQNVTYRILDSVAVMVNSAEMIVSDRNLLSYLGATDPPSIEALIGFRDTTLFYLENILNLAPALSSLCVLVDNPNIISMRAIIRNGADMFRSPALRDFIESGSFTRWRFPGEAGHDYCASVDKNSVVLLTAISGYQESPLGVAIVGMSLNAFLDAHEPSTREDSLAGILRDGKMLIPESQEDHALAASARDRVPLELSDLSSDHGLVRLRDANPVLTIGYRHIPQIGAYAVHIVSMQEMERYLSAIRWTIIASIATFVALFSLVIRGVIYRLMRRLQTMTETLRRVEEGDWDLKIDTDGDDELAELAQRFQEMIDRVNGLIKTVVTKQTAARNAQIRAVLSQINAHFIYNTLENIKMKAEIREEYAISDALTALGRLLRYSIDWRRQLVPLSEELHHVEDYLKIVNLRRDEPVVLIDRLGEVRPDLPVPKMILQPVVENSVTHAFAEQTSGCTIEVEAVESDGAVTLSVRDNGVGMTQTQQDRLTAALTAPDDPPDQEDESSIYSGIGLRNVHERLMLFYGAGCGIQLRSADNDGTQVLLMLRTEPRDADHTDR